MDIKKYLVVNGDRQDKTELSPEDYATSKALINKVLDVASGYHCDHDSVVVVVSEVEYYEEWDQEHERVLFKSDNLIYAMVGTDVDLNEEEGENGEKFEDDEECSIYWTEQDSEGVIADAAKELKDN